jgi:hypothetical protein
MDQDVPGKRAGDACLRIAALIDQKGIFLAMNGSLPAKDGVRLDDSFNIGMSAVGECLADIPRADRASALEIG